MKAVDELINEPPSNLSKRLKDTGISGRTKSNEYFLNAQNNFSQTRKRNPSNSRTLNLTGILSNTSYTTSFQNQASARTGYSSVPKSKTSFKLVFKVFCAWQAFVKKGKKNKQLKAKLLHGIVRAINFHEQHLMFKVFNAFPEAKLYDIKIKKNAIRIQKLNRQRLLKKYLSKFLCIYTEVKLIKSLSQIAQDHHIRTRQYFIYQAWLKSVKLQKKLERKITSKFKKSPKVMLTFIQFIAYNWINSSDLLEFYSFCHCKNKVKPSKKQKFIKIIKFAIKTRMQLLFKAWQTYLQPIKKFKANRCKLLKQKTIRQFKKFTRLQFRVRMFKEKRMQGLKMRSVVGLLQNVQRMATARQIGQANVENTTKLYFNQWRNLLLFFQSKSRSKPKSNQLKALLHQKQKVWNIFTSILQTKRLRTLRLETADQFIAVQRKHNLLKMLRNLKVRREELSQKQSVVNGLHQRGMVQKYFRAIIRACLIQQRQRTYRMYVLLSKGLKGLQNRVEFRRLKQNLELIGLHQYNSKLQSRSLKQFKHAITKKNQLIVLQLRGQQQSQSSLVARVWKLLQVNAATHQKYKYFDKFYALKLQEKALLKFRLAVIKSIKLKKASKIVKAQHCQLLLRAMLDKLLTQGSSKIRAKHLQNKLKRKVQMKLTSKFFTIWLSKFKFYRAKFDTVNMKHLHLVKVNAFDKWFELAKESMINARVITKFELKQNQVKKGRMMVALKRYADDRVQRRQMTMVSRFYFIKKVLTKTLYALRTNIKADILFNNREQSKQSQLVHKCFIALHKHSDQTKHLNLFTYRRNHLKKEQFLKHWNYIAFKNRRNQNIIQYFMTRRNQTLKQLVFRSILVDSVQQQYCLDTFHLRQLFQSWAGITYKQRELKRKGMQIKFVNQQLNKHVMLQQWRQNLFMELAMNKLAVPYHTTRQLKQVFGYLAQQTHKQRKYKVFHKNLILKHALKQLYKYTKLKLRSVFLSRKVQTRELSQVFGAIAEFARVRKLESLKCGLIQARVEQRITGKYLDHWRVMAVENLKLVPIERKIESKVRQKWLQKLCFASLKRYVQIRQGKKQMYQSVQNYYYELLIERTFKQLLNYTDFRSLKQTHKCRADRYYKTILLKRWILAKQQKTDGQIQLSKAYLNISLQRKALKYWLQYMRQSNRAYVMKDQASLFNAIRLKIKAIKGFAMIPYIQDYIEEPNQNYVEESYLQPQQQSNQKVAPQQSGPKLIFNLRQKNATLLLYSLALKTNHSKKLSFMKHQLKARHPMNKKSKSRKVIKKLHKQIAKHQSVNMTSKVFQLLNFRSMLSPPVFDSTFQSSFSPLIKIKGTSTIKNIYRDDQQKSSKYKLNLFKREQQQEEEANSSSSSQLSAFQEPHPQYQHETRLLQQSDCYQNLLLESGLLNSKLENSIIIAEKMLNEKPLKGSNFNDSFISQNKSGEKDVFVVQRLVNDRKQSQQWLNQFEEPFDTYSEDDEKEYAEEQDEDVDDLDNSELRIENFYDDDYKANAVSQKVKTYFQEKEELSSLRNSVKSNKVLENIKSNLNYLNLNN